jgi:hypothetical protein
MKKKQIKKKESQVIEIHIYVHNDTHSSPPFYVPPTPYNPNGPIYTC